MRLRCKFRVHTVTDRGSGVAIEADPVYPDGDEDHENRAFWEASPSGKFEIYVDNEEAFEDLKALLGREIYLDITPADDA